MRLLVGLLVGQLLPSFYIVWYDLPTNSPTNYPTNNCISWIWMRKKIRALQNSFNVQSSWFFWDFLPDWSWQTTGFWWVVTLCQSNPSCIWSWQKIRFWWSVPLFRRVVIEVSQLLSCLVNPNILLVPVEYKNPIKLYTDFY